LKGWVNGLPTVTTAAPAVEQSARQEIAATNGIGSLLNIFNVSSLRVPALDGTMRALRPQPFTRTDSRQSDQRRHCAAT